jgi:type I restriction enzyme S subunit
MRTANSINLIPLSSLMEVNPSRSLIGLAQDAEVSFVAMGDVSESGRRINYQTRQYSEVRQGFTAFAEGDVLFAKITPCMENGKGCIATDLMNAVGFGSTEFHVLRARSNSDSGFIYQWTASKDLRSVAKNSMTGSAGQQRVPSDFFEGFYIPEFPQVEQRKIGEILSAVDTAIEHTEALIAKQERIKTGLMQDLLTRGIDEHGNLRSESTHEFKDSVLGHIPVEWEVKPSIAICRQIIVGIVIRPVQYYKPSGVPVLRSANVREDCIDPSNLVYMSAKDNDTLAKSQLFTGDLVTVRTGYPGTTAAIPPEFDGCNCVDVVISRPDYNKVRSSFLSIWVNSDLGKRQVLEGQGGLAQQHFNVGAMKSLLVKVPSLTEQERIEQCLVGQRSVDGEIRIGLTKLRAIKTALMQDLLTGKKRVTALM